MVQKKATIPWAGEEAWAQAVLSIRKTISTLSDNSALRSEAATMQTLVHQIIQGYAEIDTLLERACQKSCPTCADVCCSRATVWYDLKDLLVIYLNTGVLPKSQISRRADHSCCNLTSSGCRLLRSDRPFICTWYICPEQNTLLKGLSGGDEEVDVARVIDEIKKGRNALEQVYIRASPNFSSVQAASGSKFLAMNHSCLYSLPKY